MKAIILIAVNSMITMFAASAQQTTKAPDGQWIFQKAELKAYRHGDLNGKPVETIIIADGDSLGTAGFQFEAVFRKIDAQNGQALCFIGSGTNESVYRLDDYILTLVSEGKKNEQQDAMQPAERPTPEQIMLPAIKFSVEGDTLTCSYPLYYGDSRFPFSIEAVMTITMRIEN